MVHMIGWRTLQVADFRAAVGIRGEDVQFVAGALNSNLCGSGHRCSPSSPCFEVGPEVTQTAVTTAGCSATLASSPPGSSRVGTALTSATRPASLVSAGAHPEPPGAPGGVRIGVTGGPVGGPGERTSGRVPNSSQMMMLYPVRG